jgi:hypothetical protein
LSLLRIACYSWVFPDTLDAWSSGGVELVIRDCFEPHQAIVRGS